MSPGTASGAAVLSCAGAAAGVRGVLQVCDQKAPFLPGGRQAPAGGGDQLMPTRLVLADRNRGHELLSNARERLAHRRADMRAARRCAVDYWSNARARRGRRYSRRAQ